MQEQAGKQMNVHIYVFNIYSDLQHIFNCTGKTIGWKKTLYK